jgi:type II secretory pathway pseudopilin PulG
MENVMKFLKLLKNQNGMSLVSVMMAAAMMGGLALVMTQLGTNSAKIQRKAIENQDLNAFVNNLEKNMLNKDSCQKTFAAVTGLTTSGLDDDIDGGIVNFNDDPIYQVTTSTTPSPLKTWEIERIYAVRVDRSDPKIQDHNLQLKVALKKKNIGKSFGAQEITKTIELDAIYTPAGGVEKCYSQMDNAVETAVSEALIEACNSTGPDAEISPTTGECVNGRICQIEKLALASTLPGGFTTTCDPRVPVPGIGLEGNSHSIYECGGLGGTVTTVSGKKLCQFSGASCPGGWSQDYNKTSAVSGSGDRKCGCSRPSCTTGSHSSWGSGQESCTHASVRKKGGLCIGGCQNVGSVTRRATIFAVACR